MAGIPATNQSGLVPAYNGVQFGGADGDYSMLPPQFELSVDPIYDDAGREVVAFRHILVVNAWAYHDTEANLSIDQETIRRKLLEPGRQISLGNLGLGFLTEEPEIIWGPKPISLKLNTVGRIACEINWSCEFHSAPCATDSYGGLDNFLKAYNYATVWSIDQDGNSVRTISGYIEMCQTRSLNNPARVTKVIDAFRDAIDVKVPPCFRRGPRIFSESADKTRLDFTVTDIEVLNDVLPQDMWNGSGTYGFSTGGMEGGVITQLMPSLNVSLRSADGIPYQRALEKALEIAKSKHDAMVRGMAGKGHVFVAAVSVQRGLFTDANLVTLAVDWMMTTGEFNHLKASGLYEPLPDSNYQLWRKSVNHTWTNRGNRKLYSNSADDVILSVCDQVGGVTLGTGGRGCQKQEDTPDYGIDCPPVDPKKSYIKYDVKVNYLRQDDQQAYKPAVSYIPEQNYQQTSLDSVGLSHPGRYATNQATEEVTEHYGYPQQVVRLSFALARIHFKPDAPSLTTLGGKPVSAELINEREKTGMAGDYGCPIYTLQGYRDYRIKDHVARQDLNFGSPLIPHGDPVSSNI